MIQTFAGKASGIYEGIRHQVTVGTTVGADETGTCINGKNGWTWVFQTPQATYIHSDTSRGKKVIDQLFHQGFPQSVLVHDCWKSYFSVPAAGHQICVAHLLRELKYLNKLYPNRQWSADFTSLLHRALDLKRTLTGPEDYTQPQSVQARTKLEEELNTVLLHVIDPKDDKLKTFHERIVNYRDYLFPFLYRQDISPDNNASERAIRTFKVKQKVSGLFRSGEGAKSFAVIRSVIDTTIKNAKNILEVLTLVPCITNDS
jgi:transposase